MMIRRAKKEDVPKIVQMLATDALGRLREDFKEPLPKTYIDAFQAIDSDSNQELVVIEGQKGDVVGTLQLTFIQYLTYQGGIRAQIEAVRVHQEHRGKGIGKMLFEWAINHSKQKGAHVIQLTTDKKRPEALQFYKSLGFMDSHEGMKLHLNTN